MYRNTVGVTADRNFAAPGSLQEALENVTSLLGDRDDARTDYNLLMVACYGPLFRWDPVKGRYEFQARSQFPAGLRDTALITARTLTSEVVRVLGGESGATLRDVRNAIDNLG